MYREHSAGHGCAPMIIVVATLAFIGVGVWWVESRFGSLTAILLVGGLFGVLCLIVGNMLALANTRSTLDAAARFNESLATTEKHRQMTYRENARGSAAWEKTNAQLTLLDAKRVDQLAQQRAGLLMDLERQKQQPRQGDAWRWDNDDSDGDQWNVME